MIVIILYKAAPCAHKRAGAPMRAFPKLLSEEKSQPCLMMPLTFVQSPRSSQMVLKLGLGPS
jgi:hypothetical protein